MEDCNGFNTRAPVPVGDHRTGRPRSGHCCVHRISPCLRRGCRQAGQPLPGCGPPLPDLARAQRHRARDGRLHGDRTFSTARLRVPGGAAVIHPAPRGEQAEDLAPSDDVRALPRAGGENRNPWRAGRESPAARRVRRALARRWLCVSHHRFVSSRMHRPHCLAPFCADPPARSEPGCLCTIPETAVRLLDSRGVLRPEDAFSRGSLRMGSPQVLRIPCLDRPD